MIRPLYDWTLRLAGHKRAEWALGAVSFIESSVFPIPPDALLVPMVLARRERAWWIATICTVTSVVGGVAGYLIGYFLWDTVGRSVMEFYGHADKFDAFRAMYDEWGFWIVAGAGFTPFPYKVITIASGVFALNPFTFLLASVVSRGARFFIVAALLWRFGPPIRAFIEKNLGWLTLVFFFLLLGGFALLRYAV